MALVNDFEDEVLVLLLLVTLILVLDPVLAAIQFFPIHNKKLFLNNSN